MKESRDNPTQRDVRPGGEPFADGSGLAVHRNGAGARTESPRLRGRLPALAPRTSEKQLVRVLDAVKNGSATALEVSEATGLPFRHCSAYLVELARDGVIHKTGTAPNRRGDGFPGMRANFYVPAEAA